MKSIPLFGVVNTPEMENIVLDTMRSGKIAGGDFVSRFESDLGALVHAENVVSTTDMTSAIHLALHLADVKVGDEVITTSFTCLSTTSPIASMGAVAVWVDVIAESVFMDPEKLLAAITPRTKAVLVYHVAGYPGPIDEIAKICRERGIKLIEDCNNALLANYQGFGVGYWGDFSIYSFYPNRQINTTEGGALICKNEADARRAKKLRRFGIDFKTFRLPNGEINSESDVSEAGWAYTMNNLCAALGCVQINYAQDRVARARVNADIYSGRLSECTELKAIAPMNNSSPSYWTFLIYANQREKLASFLKNKNIGVSTLHQSNHKYSCFKNHKSAAFLLNTEELAKHVISIPCGWWLDEQDAHYVANLLCEFDEGNKELNIPKN